MKAESYEEQGMTVSHHVELHKVNVIEYDLSYGQKLDQIQYFKTEQEARTWCQNYNKENRIDAEHAPDWYMQAEYVGCQLVPVFKE